MIKPRACAGLAVAKDNFVFDMGGINITSAIRSVDELVLSSESPCWRPSVDMLVKRLLLGVGVINNYIYAVSYVELEFISSLVNSVIK